MQFQAKYLADPIGSHEAKIKSHPEQVMPEVAQILCSEAKFTADKSRQGGFTVNTETLDIRTNKKRVPECVFKTLNFSKSPIPFHVVYYFLGLKK